MKKLLLVLLCLALFMPSAFADRKKVRSALSAARVAVKKQADFEKRLNKLTRRERLALKKALNGSERYGLDSDDDGLPNLYEDAVESNLCDSDTDDDGKDDGVDGDESEVEVTGPVVSFADPELVVGDKTFILSDETVFRGGGFTKDDLAPGLCIEIEGIINEEGKLDATKIKAEDSCGDSEDDDSNDDD